MRKKWSKKEDEFLKVNFNILAYSQLAKKLKRTEIAVKNRAKTLKLKRPKGSRFVNGRLLSYDHNFFKIPNILNSYWAGFIAADGCVHKTNALSIGLGEKDKYLLDRFKKDIGSNHRIHKISGKNHTILGKGCVVGNTYIFTIGGGKNTFMKDLYNNWNITPQKTHTLQPPNITDPKHIAAYICGYFDGDGWVSRYKTNTVCNNIKYYYQCFKMGFCSSNPDILVWIQNQLKIMLPDLPWKGRLQRSRKLYMLIYTHNKGRKIHQYLKKIIDIPRLDRKWEVDYENIKLHQETLN